MPGPGRGSFGTGADRSRQNFSLAFWLGLCYTKKH
nr:MAG TPA: hypothetical protein [Caudoviricetes sp.]